MPKYSYKCISCETILETYHSMTEVKEDCEKCGDQDSLQKIPSKFSLTSTKKETKKVGTLVKESIEGFREEIEQEKHRLKNELYRTDE